MTISSVAKKMTLSVLGAACLAVGTINSAQAAELVSNGGFESGDFSGWTQSGNPGFTGVTNSVANSGNSSAFFGPVGSPGFLSQSLATVTGASYLLSFFLQNYGGTPSLFQALIDGSPVFSQIDAPAQPFTLYNYNFVAAGASTNLAFAFRQDPSFFYLDDVSVSGVAGVPTPALLPALLGMGAAAIRKRKGEAAEAEAEAVEVNA